MGSYLMGGSVDFNIWKPFFNHWNSGSYKKKSLSAVEYGERQANRLCCSRYICMPPPIIAGRSPLPSLQQVAYAAWPICAFAAMRGWCLGNIVLNGVLACADVWLRFQLLIRHDKV